MLTMATGGIIHTHAIAISTVAALQLCTLIIVSGNTAQPSDVSSNTMAARLAVQSASQDCSLLCQEERHSLASLFEWCHR